MGKKRGGSGEHVRALSIHAFHAGQRSVKLLKKESTYGNQRRKALGSLGEATRLIKVLLSSLVKRHSGIWK